MKNKYKCLKLFCYTIFYCFYNPKTFLWYLGKDFKIKVSRICKMSFFKTYTIAKIKGFVCNTGSQINQAVTNVHNGIASENDLMKGYL